MSLHSDERAIGYQLIILIILIATTSLIMAVFWGPLNGIKDAGEQQADGGMYESYGDEGLGYAWDAFLALPAITTFLGFTFVIVWAVVLSSAGVT